MNMYRRREYLFQSSNLLWSGQRQRSIMPLGWGVLPQFVYFSPRKIIIIGVLLTSFSFNNLGRAISNVCTLHFRKSFSFSPTWSILFPNVLELFFQIFFLLFSCSVPAKVSLEVLLHFDGSRLSPAVPLGFGQVSRTLENIFLALGLKFQVTGPIFFRAFLDFKMITDDQRVKLINLTRGNPPHLYQFSKENIERLRLIGEFES